MNKRTLHKFAELYQMTSGISSKPEQAGHGAPFLSFSTVFNNYFLPDQLADRMDTSDSEQKKYSICEGDIFLTRTSEVVDELGMSCVALKDYPNATYSGFLKRLRPTGEGLTYPKFMAFYLRSSLFRKAMTNNTVLTLRASLNEAVFSYFDLLLPDYEEQIRIGDLLHLLHAKIDCNNQINAELEAMANALFDYWFVQFDFPFDFASGKPAQNGKPYKSSGGKMVYNPTLKREIPAGWKGSNILAVADLLGGGTPTKKNPEYWNGHIPFFTPTDADGTMFKFSTADSITEEGLEKSSTKLFAKNTVFITARGSVGKLVLTGSDMAMNQSCYALRAKPGISHTYLFFLAKELIHHLEVKSSGSVFNSIVSNDIEFTLLAIPDPAVVEKYAAVVERAFERIANNTKENQHLTQLRDWLLPMLMNGQVTVK